MKTKTLPFLLISCMVAIAACTKEVPETVTPPAQEEAEEGYFYTFTLLSDETKTAFGDKHIAWNVDDLLGSYATKTTSETSVNQSSKVKTYEEEGKTYANLKVKSTIALEAGDMVYAYYPFSADNDSNPASSVTMSIPANQSTANADAMPMVSIPVELDKTISAGTATTVGELRFLNLGSIIKLNIYSGNADYRGEAIKSVTFNAGAACAGSFSYDITSVNPESMAALSGYSETSVNLSVEGVEVGENSDNGGVVYVVVAPGTYQGSLKISTGAADYTYSFTSSRTYSRATIKPFNIDISGSNWTRTATGKTINSASELVTFLSTTSIEDQDSYLITANLDMTGCEITSASDFSGVLDGGSHTVSNLSSSVPLFAKNHGTIKNLTFDSSCTFTPSSRTSGMLVYQDAAGTYEEVHTAAAVTKTIEANLSDNIVLGGLVGNSYGGTFNNCSNSGSVTVNAGTYYHNTLALGGLIGLAEGLTKLTGCSNSGPVSDLALYGNPRGSTIGGQMSNYSHPGVNVGGLVGYSRGAEDSSLSGNAAQSAYVLEHCLVLDGCRNEAGGVITVNHTQADAIASKTNTGSINVGGVLGGGDSKMLSTKNLAQINVTGTASDAYTRQNAIKRVGGMVGYTYWINAFESCTNNGNINIVDYNIYENGATMGQIGGICGYGASDQDVEDYAHYCKNRGQITVTGKGTMSVGGIYGFSMAKMIGCQVFEGGGISYNGRKGYIGGFVGTMSGLAVETTVKACAFDGNISAYCDWGDTKTAYIYVGGLIGNRLEATMAESTSCLTAKDGTPCSFNGSITTDQIKHVGMILGEAGKDGSKTMYFGTEEYPIKVNGTIKKGDAGSPVTITSTNLASYQIGASPTSNLTIWATCQNIAPTGTVFKAMSFNIRGSENWSSRKSALCSMINGESADIIGLQEVKDLDAWDHLTEDHPWDYIKDHVSGYTGYRPNKIGNAILFKTSRFEISSQGSFNLVDSDYDRCVLYATVYDKTNAQYFFFLTGHFPLKQAARNDAVALVESKIATLNTNNYPVVLMGDFNGVNGDECFNDLKKTMKNTRYSASEYYSSDNQSLYTYNAWGDSSKDRQKIDHIWVSKSGLFTTYYITLTQEIRKYGSVDYLSDHFPIIATISF